MLQFAAYVPGELQYFHVSLVLISWNIKPWAIMHIKICYLKIIKEKIILEENREKAGGRDHYISGIASRNDIKPLHITK